MFVRSFAAAACVVSLIACAGADPEPSAASDQAAIAAAPSCGGSYGPANELYKQSVAIAKQHKISACDGVNGSNEGAYLSSVGRKAADAVALCGAFANVIKTSQWAAPIREELAGTLMLPYLTGDLVVTDAAGKTVFQGLDKAIVGVTMWGPASGVYGNHKKIEFGANGAAKISTLEWTSNNAMQPEWRTVDATYTIGAVSGDAVKITIVQGPTTADFELRSTKNEWEGPGFELQAIGGDASDLYTAYYSECEA